MNRHALVIGSQTHGLQGVLHDVQRMTEALQRRGFAVDTRTGERATRAGILTGYDELIARVGSIDAAVVYYAGHGTLAVNPHVEDGIRTMQAIVPTDAVTGSSEFRAITTWELGIKLQQLTTRTRNVTVILDCCHAAQMTREGASRQVVPRALPHPLHAGFREHLRALRTTYGNVTLDPIANPDAVRLVACAQSESAYEYVRTDGTAAGVFTDALLDVLEDIGMAAISWAAVADAVRERVLGKLAIQRPDVEGPSRRRLFLLETEDRTGIVPVSSQGREIHVHSGRLLGTRVGDSYGAMPLGSTEYNEARAIATLRITAVSALVASTVAEWKNGHTTLPADAVAIPLERTSPTFPVELIVPDAERAALERAIAASRTLHVARPGEETAPLVWLRLDQHRLTIEDAAGPMFPAASYPADLADTIKNVANLGVARRIRELVGEHGLSSLDARDIVTLEISWGVVERGQPQPMPDHGASLGLGDRIYIRVRNTGSEPRYVHIFNVGVRGKVTLLTRNLAPAGCALNNSVQQLVLGERNGQLVGLALSWPSGLSQDTFPRIDEIYVFVTAQPVSLHHLETQEYSLRGVRGVTRGSPLQELLAQTQDSVTRNVGRPEPIEGYLVKRLSYQLHPRQASMADIIAFQIDENPGQRAAAQSRGAWFSDIDPVPRDARAAASSTAIEIRLEDLVVERERALRGSDIRIDALACTRSADRPGVITARTLRSRGISDGESIGVAAPIFRGPVRDFVDIYLWISHDTSGGRDLDELLAMRAESPQLRDAATALVATGDAAATPWILAVGASAALARIAYDLLAEISGTTIGLYRTSFVATEQYGIGRHPEDGPYRARDLSFSLRIDSAEHG